MRPELIGLVILSIAVVTVSLLMLADHKGWRSPLPTFHLDRRWVGLTYILMALLAALSGLRFAGVM